MYMQTKSVSVGWSGDRIQAGAKFLHPFSLALGPTQPPAQLVPTLFPGGTALGARRWPPAQILRRS